MEGWRSLKPHHYSTQIELSGMARRPICDNNNSVPHAVALNVYSEGLEHT
jgi:hypothetical protein